MREEPKYKRGEAVFCNYIYEYGKWVNRVGIVLDIDRPENGLFDFYTVLIGQVKEDFIEFVLDPITSGSVTMEA